MSISTFQRVCGHERVRVCVHQLCMVNVTERLLNRCLSGWK